MGRNNAGSDKKTKQMSPGNGKADHVNILRLKLVLLPG